MNQTLNDISLVTYTHSNCADVLHVYLGQLDKHAPVLNSHIFINDKNHVKNCRHHVTQYIESKPYHQQWLASITEVKTEYVIYMQEDFILYDDVSISSLTRYMNILNESNHSFVRLIRAGFDNSLVHVKDDLYAVNPNSPDIYQQQATLWKKDDLIKVYEKTQSIKWLESDAWRQSVRDLGMSGVFVYNNEKQRGKYHYDSDVFPYVCTAVSRGLWNLNEYPKELGEILNNYGVDPLVRGIRKDYNYAK